MPGLTALVSRTVVLPERNIDTDQIIPARFLTTTQRKGLGRHAFHDWRRLPDGAPDPDFPFNQAGNADARILVAGRNFEGRQGPGARTLLASPLTAAVCAIAGEVADPRAFLAGADAPATRTQAA